MTQNNNKKEKNQTKPKRQRRTTHDLADYLLKHSPLKPGVVLKNEDDPITNYNKIGNRLYLGNMEAAQDKDFFKKRNIKAVLNCTKDLPNYKIKKGDVEYMRIPVDDSLKDKDFELMYQYMPAAVEFIYKNINLQNQNVLVHCYAGRQRSAICVAAYLVAKHKMTPHEACKHILDKRMESFHFGQSLNFDTSLNRFYQDIQKTNKKK